VDNTGNDPQRCNSGRIEILGRNMVRKFEEKTREMSEKTVGLLFEIRAEYLHNTNEKNTAALFRTSSNRIFIHVTKKSENVLCCVVLCCVVCVV
jgi:uncharacterized membrane protein